MSAEVERWKNLRGLGGDERTSRYGYPGPGEYDPEGAGVAQEKEEREYREAGDALAAALEAEREEKDNWRVAARYAWDQLEARDRRIAALERELDDWIATARAAISKRDELIFHHDGAAQERLKLQRRVAELEAGVEKIKGKLPGIDGPTYDSWVIASDLLKGRAAGGEG